jgi:hypothetical protein
MRKIARSFRNWWRCKGLVKKSPIISCGGQYSTLISVDKIRNKEVADVKMSRTLAAEEASFLLKGDGTQVVLICDSCRVETLGCHEIRCPEHTSHTVINTTTSSASVELLVLSFCLDDTEKIEPYHSS